MLPTPSIPLRNRDPFAFSLAVSHHHDLSREVECEELGSLAFHENVRRIVSVSTCP